jgi:hypothetical protein
LVPQAKNKLKRAPLMHTIVNNKGISSFVPVKIEVETMEFNENNIQCSDITLNITGSQKS